MTHLWKMLYVMFVCLKYLFFVCWAFSIVMIFDIVSSIKLSHGLEGQWVTFVLSFRSLLPVYSIFHFLAVVLTFLKMVRIISITDKQVKKRFFAYLASGMLILDVAFLVLFNYAIIHIRS